MDPEARAARFVSTGPGIPRHGRSASHSAEGGVARRYGIDLSRTSSVRFGRLVKALRDRSLQPSRVSRRRISIQ